MSVPSRPYELDEASLALPCELKDKTNHLFTISDQGPSPFNLVVSRHEVPTEESLFEVADRISAELKKALPKFQLKRREECALDGQPAIELFYAWVQKGTVLQQRQTITLVKAWHQADEDPRPQALMISATCANGFTPQWNAMYEQVLASVQIRRPWVISEEPPQSSIEEDLSPVSPGAPGYVFALRQSVLRVFAGPEQATAEISVQEAGTWKFYDTHGQPMETALTGDGYELRIGAASSARGPLHYRLALVDQVLGVLTSLPEVTTHLAQWGQEGAGA